MITDYQTRELGNQRRHRESTAQVVCFTSYGRFRTAARPSPSVTFSLASNRAPPCGAARISSRAHLPHLSIWVGHVRR